MGYRRFSKWILIITIIILVIANIANYNQNFRIFIGAFGFGATFILWILGNASNYDD